MTAFVDIKPGQWLLAFDHPFGPYLESMPDHLENFTGRGGGWESCKASEIFLIHQVGNVRPKTYYDVDAQRHDRVCVIASFVRREDALALRDKLYAIGVETDDAIEAEMYRRVAKFAAKKRAQAERKIHRLLPAFFGRDA